MPVGESPIISSAIIPHLDDKFLALAADDIRRHLEDYAEHEPSPNLWRGLLDALETEQRERAARQARKIRPCPDLRETLGGHEHY